MAKTVPKSVPGVPMLCGCRITRTFYRGVRASDPQDEFKRQMEN